MDLLSTLSTLIPVLTAIASLAYWLGRKFAEINEEFKLIDRRFAEVDKRFKRLESAFIQFADTLLTVLGSKGILTDTEVFALKSAVRSMIPTPKSKYYTEEVRKKLLELLDKDPHDYTIGDTEELENIADLIEKEGFETERRDLMRYAWMLRYYAMVVRAVYIYPKLSKCAGKLPLP
jgi:hypothetical protein